jgi:hypothetical protein
LIFDLVQQVAPFFAVATGTSISCSLGRRYGPVFSLTFIDVYGLNSAVARTRFENGEKEMFVER